MKNNFKKLIAFCLLIVCVAAHAIRGGRGGFHGGGRWRGAGGQPHRWNRPYRGRWGWSGAPAVGFGVSVNQTPAYYSNPPSVCWKPGYDPDTDGDYQQWLADQFGDGSTLYWQYLNAYNTCLYGTTDQSNVSLDFGAAAPFYGRRGFYSGPYRHRGRGGNFRGGVRRK